MYRLSALLLTAAALSACASTAPKTINPLATQIEVKAPEPVISPEAKEAMMEKEAMTETDAAAAAAPTLLYAAQTKWEMMAFVEAVQKADMQSALEGEAPLTVFAPMTSAFEQTGNKTVSAKQLKRHIVAGAISAQDLTARAAKGQSTLTTITGEELSIYVSGEAVKIADPSGRLYTVTQADIAAENGILHMINGVFSGK